MLEISREAAEIIDRQRYLREVDRSGRPHFLVKVPDLEKASEAELGIEILQNDEGNLVVTLLVYDIPDEPVVCDIPFDTANSEDVSFLRAMIDSVVFHLHPCALVEGGYRTCQPIALRLPPNLLLRLKHYSREFRDESGQKKSASPLIPETLSPSLSPEEPKGEEEPAQDSPAIRNLKSSLSGTDARETVIRKLKEQVQALRLQVKEKEKRIIELEDELGEYKSGKRQYRLGGGSEKKSWWKPF